MAGPEPYDQSYFDKYTGYAQTDLGRELTNLRVDLVNKFLPTGMHVCDIGIGCGQFLEAIDRYRPCWGYDVNPVAVQWLQQAGRWLDPYIEARPYVLTFWDSFEHIQRPAVLLQACRPRFVFMSLPIFRDLAHVLRSKHFRPDEHFWYFTTWGLIKEMGRAGYRCLAVNFDETAAGREDIGTFVFERS